MKRALTESGARAFHLAQAPALGLTAGSLVVGFSGGSTLGLMAAAALVVWGLGVGWRWRHWLQRHDADMTTYLQSRSAFAEQLSRMWGCQIRSSRCQMEATLAALTGRFAAMVERLNQALGRPSDADGGVHILQSTFAHRNSEQSTVFEALHRAVHSKNRLVEKVQALGGGISEPDEMAEAFERKAEQTAVLAMNAAMGATRAGMLGRSLAVPTQEVRSLSVPFGETGTPMTARLGAINSAILAARQLAEASAAQDAAEAGRSRDKVEDVLAGVLAELQRATYFVTDAAAALRVESLGIKGEIDEVFAQLQFQGKANQTLSHLQQNIERLPAALAALPQTRLEPLDASSLLDELVSFGAMVDERALH